MKLSLTRLDATTRTVHPCVVVCVEFDVQNVDAQEVRVRH